MFQKLSTISSKHMMENLEDYISLSIYIYIHSHISLSLYIYIYTHVYILQAHDGEECRYPGEPLRPERSQVKATHGRPARGLPRRNMSIERKKASASRRACLMLRFFEESLRSKKQPLAESVYTKILLTRKFESILTTLSGFEANHLLAAVVKSPRGGRRCNCVSWTLHH